MRRRRRWHVAEAARVLAHIDLTVTDVERAVQWWQEVMGFVLMFPPHRETSYRIANLQHRTGVILSVITHDEPLPGAFDERRVGLDHFAFQVGDRDELEQWVEHLDSCSVSHSPISDR